MRGIDDGKIVTERSGQRAQQAGRCALAFLRRSYISCQSRGKGDSGPTAVGSHPLHVRKVESGEIDGVCEHM